MKKELKQVKQFQKKYGFSIGVDFNDAMTDANDIHLSNIAENVSKSAILVEDLLDDDDNKDARLLRTHLMLEELSEVIFALSRRDEVALLDGLVDLLYVVIGTGTNLPIEEAFDAVHTSNMTKKRKEDDSRLRNKGDEYKPPNLAAVLTKYKTIKETER